MKDYQINGNTIVITLENDKKVKCGLQWAEKTMKALDTDLDDVILMWLEDNDYLINEEQQELIEKTKGQYKNIVKKDTTAKKTQKERVAKENPTKELIITTIAEALKNLNVNNLTIENKAKLITFNYNDEDFKVDLVQKRKPKN